MLTIEGVTHTLQALLFVGPIVAYIVDQADRASACRRRIARSRCTASSPVASSACPVASTSRCTSTLSEYERWRLVELPGLQAADDPPERRGKITFGQRMRAGLSRWFFEDRISPVTTGEIEQSKDHH